MRALAFEEGRMLLDLREAARALNLSQRTVWAHTAPRGDLPCVRIGQRRLYRPQDLARWAESHLVTKGTADGATTT